MAQQNERSKSSAHVSGDTDAAGRTFTVAFGKATAPAVEHKDLSWPEFAALLSEPERSRETFAEYQAMGKEQRAELKKAPGYIVPGVFDPPARKAENIQKRSMVSLDIDDPPGDWRELLAKAYGGLLHQWHTSRSHSPEAPKLRVFLPSSRVLEPWEYEPVTRVLAARFGMKYVDRVSYRVAQPMFLPGASADGEFLAGGAAGEPFDPDAMLTGAGVDPNDPDTWPRKPGEDAPRVSAAKAEDPTSKDNLIGDFCRAYSVHDAIAEFIPDAYAPTADPDRYTWTGGKGAAGAIVYEQGRFLYSVHETDPVFQHLYNPWDLVRVHKFGHLDPENEADLKLTPHNLLPSYKALQELARGDEAVRKETRERERRKAEAERQELEDRIAAFELFDGTADPEGFKRLSAVLEKLAGMPLPWVEKDHTLQRLKKIDGNLNINVLRRQLKEYTAAAKDEDGPKRLNHHEIAEEWITAWGNPRPVADEGAVWTFDKRRGVWTRLDISDVAVRVAEGYHAMLLTESAFRGVARHIHDMLAQPGYFTGGPLGIATPGGFIRFEAGDLLTEPLAPEHRQRSIVPADPEPGEPVQFLELLRRTFAGEDCEAQIRLVQEIFGAAVLGTMAKHQKAALFKGPGAAGKSTVLKVLEALFDKPVVAALSPFRWDNEYYAAALAGKRVNLVGELTSGNPIPGEIFKQVTGGDIVTGRHPTERPFTFKCTAAHIFNSNHFIATKEHTTAFYRRWLVVVFRNAVRDADQIRDLDRRIIHDELGRVLSWALEGGLRVERQNGFTKTASHLEAMAEWRRDTDSVAAFLHDKDHVRIDPKAWTPRATLYEAYRGWCRGDTRQPVSRSHFYQRAESLALFVATMRQGQRGYTGVASALFPPLQGAG